MANNKDNRFGHYPETALFKIIDTIGIPHPFMITPKHINHASSHFSGILSKEVLQDYENKNGGKSSCGWTNCNLTHAEHETALVVQINSTKILLALEAELKPYLLKCKPICEKDGYSGFAFIQKNLKPESNTTIH